ncbi:uncharacterized protein LOC108630824 [Ceratina calcarata]|uniref:Uncharacterized protein LOC108630824 n=1 Tax=Ceratina calcarata TaxID=156304 RepID=A0AAJ7NDE6_9HYME|nr:uncharacterized protein LOC108630824 [Ceratina calcarata]
MPHPCIVCGRSRMNPSNKEEEYTFFGFPVNDEDRCKKWLEFCCREDLYKLTKKQLLQRMVCSKHFEQGDFISDHLSYQDKLSCIAVPSIYDPKQSLYNITCVVCGRSRRDPPGADYDGATFHHFPGEEFRCLKWLDFVGVDSYYRLTRKEILFCYICSKHFDRSQFMTGYKNRLVDNAIPTIRNPDVLDGSEQYVTEYVSEPKGTSSEETKSPLSLSVLDSQACAACGRSRSDPRNKIEKYKFHPFPAYEIGRCLRWCHFLDREDILKMSPNQIRKLVLCSKHFETGQDFNKVGPCDAVPTIKDVSQVNTVNSEENVNDDQQPLEESNCTNGAKGNKRQGVSRPLVSSKKPKVDNKPTPLAKKRGKSRRPIHINIPRPDPNNLENRMVKKLPLPPNSNWKIQIADQLQPITIANPITSNSIASNITNVQGNIKKVILPFATDISNLGAPIPVHSLSSIPPGLLIKIDLPEQEQQAKTITRLNKTKIAHAPTTSNEVDQPQQVWLKNGETLETISLLNHRKQETDKNLVEFLSSSLDDSGDQMTTDELEGNEESILPHALEVLDEEVENVKEALYEDFEEVECLPPKPQKPVKRKKISAMMRRTIFPIRNEVKYFLRKLAPHMHRLPRRTRAQIKLSIVNMVIDHL